MWVATPPPTHKPHAQLLLQMVMGSMMSAFAEGLALADRASLSQEALLEVLDLGAMSNPM